MRASEKRGWPSAGSPGGLPTCIAACVLSLSVAAFGQSTSHGPPPSTYLISTEDALRRPRKNIIKVTGRPQLRWDDGSIDRTYDARGWSTTMKFTKAMADQYPVVMGKRNPGTRQVWIGGTVTGSYPESTTWGEMKGPYDGAGHFGTDREWFVVDGMRIHNVMDALRPHNNAARFAYRNIYASYIRDDAIENDNMMGGQVYDCLFDGCYMFFSQQGTRWKWDTSSDPVEIAYTLVRLEPMAFGAGSKYKNKADLYGGPGADRHAHLFKHHNATDAPLVVHDCIFYVPQYTVNSTREMGFPEYAGCRYTNNILLWTGGGAYPASLPASGVTEYNLVNSTQTKIDEIWNDAVHDWKVRHGYAEATAARGGPSEAKPSSKTSRAARPLDAFADDLVQVRRAARDGDFEGAIAACTEVLVEHIDSQGFEALRTFADGLAAGAQLKDVVIERAAGVRPTVYIETGAGPQRVTLVGADAKGVRVEMKGTAMPIAWRGISPRRFYGIAAKLVADVSVSHLALARYCATMGLHAEARAELSRVGRDLSDEARRVRALVK